MQQISITAFARIPWPVHNRGAFSANTAAASKPMIALI
jgi:hypothetical protein